MSLPISIRAELFKTKRTASLYLTLVIAAVVPFIFLLDATVDGISPENRSSIFSKMFSEGFKMTGFVMLPLFIVLISTLLPQLEYKNNAWKQVLTSPQTKGNVYLAKFINIHLLILLFLVANQLFMLLSAIALHFMEPSFNVLNQPLHIYDVLVNILNSYATLLAFSTIQFWLGLRFKNFIVPLAIGISMWFVGSMLVLEFKSGFSIYFPYSFHVYSVFPKIKHQLNAVEWTSGAYAVAFLLLGFIDFKTRKLKA